MPTHNDNQTLTANYVMRCCITSEVGCEPTYISFCSAANVFSSGSWPQISISSSLNDHVASHQNMQQFQWNAACSLF
jgi:hypothetical protein